MTSDADILPISRKFYELNSINFIHVLNADCCGSINVGVHEVFMQPMTNVVGTRLNWRKLMDLPTVHDLTDLDIPKWLSDHGFDQLSHSPIEKGENDQ